MGDKIFRWLVFGVIVSLLPFLYVRFRNWLFDSETLELNYLLDLLLITFAISANAVNLLWDGEKEIKRIIKRVVIFLLIVMMFGCAATYASLFEQSMRNNRRLEEYEKRLEEYEEFLDSVEAHSEDLTNNSDDREIVQRLLDIKSIDNEEEAVPKIDKLKQVSCISIILLIAVTVLGVVVECADDRNRKKRSGSIYNGKTNPPGGSAQENPAKRDGA